MIAACPRCSARYRVQRDRLTGDGVRLRSHITLLDATSKGKGEYLLKTCHEIEADQVEDKVLYAEYLTYWFPK